MRVVVLGAAAVAAAALVAVGVAGSQAVLPTGHVGAVGPQVRAAVHRPPETIHRVRPRGTNAWRLAKPALAGQIQGYATAVSALPGQAVGLRVSTTARRFRVRAFRFGWYRGGAAHLVWRSGWLPGERQAGSTFSDYETRTVVANWHRSATISTVGWTPGVYLLQLIASTGWQYDVPLVVRSPSVQGRVVLVAPVATWQAYNTWGGYSLYQGAGGDRPAFAVSFDRPFAAPGHADLLYGVVPVVVEAERLGIPLAYRTDLDLTGRRSLAGARAYVSMGHDEYWTPSMRRAVLWARSRGTNLAFLGADTEYWRIRLGPAATGSRRVVVGYRWSYPQDPLYVRGSGRATAPFGYPPLPRPEEALTGLRYECYPVDAAYRVTSPRWWGYAGTRVHAGSSFAHLVGIEADGVHPGPATPRPMQVLSDSPYSCLGTATSAQSVYYTSASGAGVFNAGTLRWTCALHRRCGDVTVSRAAARFTRRVTANVLRVFATGPAGRTHPTIDNLGGYQLGAGWTAPAG